MLCARKILLNSFPKYSAKMSRIVCVWLKTTRQHIFHWRTKEKYVRIFLIPHATITTPDNRMSSNAQCSILKLSCKRITWTILLTIFGQQSYLVSYNHTIIANNHSKLLPWFFMLCVNTFLFQTQLSPKCPHNITKHYYYCCSTRDHHRRRMKGTKVSFMRTKERESHFIAQCNTATKTVSSFSSNKNKFQCIDSEFHEFFFNRSVCP